MRLLHVSTQFSPAFRHPTSCSKPSTQRALNYSGRLGLTVLSLLIPTMFHTVAWGYTIASNAPDTRASTSACTTPCPYYAVDVATFCTTLTNTREANFSSIARRPRWRPSNSYGRGSPTKYGPSLTMRKSILASNEQLPTQPQSPLSNMYVARTSVTLPPAKNKKQRYNGL